MVVSALGEFGKLIQNMLEDTGLYKVMVVDSEQEAILCIQTVAFSIAILDAELPGGSLLALASLMRQKLPKMRLVVFCSEANPVYPAVVAFQPAGLLKKPLLIPDLLDTLTKALQNPNPPENRPESRSVKAADTVIASQVPPAPEWLQDANWAARNLTQLSLETSAQGALIVRDGALWAYAGELSQPAVSELVDSLVSFWDDDSKVASKPSNHSGAMGDMVRFIHLDATQGEYMLYATSLGQGMVLALVFETETPFSTIRTQAGYLARALASPPGTPLPPYPKAASVMTTPVSANASSTYPRSAQLPPILEDVPPPTPHKRLTMPDKRDQHPSWFEEASAPASLSETTQQPKVHPILDSARDIPKQLPNQEPESVNSTHPSTGSSIEIPISPEKPGNQPANPRRTDSHQVPAEQNPPWNEKSTMSPKLLPASPTLHYLTYSCTLLPRLPQHQIGGDLAHLLKDWMPQLFLAFGWQLLQMIIQPEYLIVIARVTPNTAPGSLIRIIRQQTSRRIFTAFPRFAMDNPSNDFWAPGYLILSNSQPPPPHIIRHFIEQTRLQQGAPDNG